MTIRIKNISAENCGPLSKFNLDPANLNLIYGKNEAGKSFLVEFIIRCLFKNRKPWGYLRGTGTGRITINGLEEKPVYFKPDKGLKLENYFEKDDRGLPLSLLNLLIVKEGETGIVNNEEGITIEAIRDLISSRRTLDAISNGISATIKQAVIEPEITVDRRGARDYYTKQEELAKINETISQLNTEDSHWKIKDLKLIVEQLIKNKEALLKARKYKAFRLAGEIEIMTGTLAKFPEEIIKKIDELITKNEKYKISIESLKKEIDRLSEHIKNIPDLEARKTQILKAKRFKAFSIAEKIRSIKEELNFFPEEEIQRLENYISTYSEKKDELENRNKLADEAGNKSKDYEWLKAAVENYQKFLLTSETFKKPPVFLIPSAIILFISGISLILMNQKIPGILVLLTGSALAVYFYFKSIKLISTFKFSHELEEIQKEFKERFGEELKNITQLENILNEQEKFHHKLNSQHEEITRVRTELESLKRSIKASLKQLFIDKNYEENEWKQIVSEIKKKRKLKSDEIQQLKEQLATLETDESEFERKDPEIQFEKTVFEEVKTELAKLKEIEKQVNSKKIELKHLEDIKEEIKNEIFTLFKKLTDQEISENDWSIKLLEIKSYRNDLIQKVESRKGELTGLGIQESEYLTTDPGIEFSQSELDRIDNEIQLLNEEIKKADENLTILKTKLISLTGADAVTGWNDLIDRLYRFKETSEKELEDIKAGIIAGKLLYDTIQELQQEEDEKLKDILNSRDVSSALYELTGRYQRLSFDDTGIIVSDEYNDFYLKDLSTGAMEQVMIALRTGFLKKILKKETAFLILDDAFQHSDYEKREMLVKTMCELSRSGWQVIYLTMDDHIRNIFHKYQTTDYKEIDLSNSTLFVQ